MRRTITPVAGALILACLLSGGRAAAQGGPPEPPELESPDETTPELRQALRDFYVRSLVEELGLSAEQERAVRPRVEALLDAQRLGVEGRRDVGLRVLRAGRLELAATGADRAEAAAAVEAALKAQADERARIAAARQAVLAELNPRQAAGFLGFEGRFQHRIQQVLERRRGGGAPDGPSHPPGGPRREGPETDPRHRPEGGPDLPPADAPGPRGDEARKTALLVFTHELRQRLELTDAQALAILPRVEALFEARLRGERQRRLLQARLLEAADDAATSDADLRALVSEALKHDVDAPARIQAALAQALEGLSPVQSARFLLLDHRAERELREQARRAREGWSGGPRRSGGGAEPRGGLRPDGGGGLRPDDGGGLRPDGGGGLRPRGGGPRPDGGGLRPRGGDAPRRF